jgi:hypothetical protein
MDALWPAATAPPRRWVTADMQNVQNANTSGHLGEIILKPNSMVVELPENLL